MISLEEVDMNESGQTKSCLRVLHLEDDPLDAELIKSALEDQKIPCAFTQVRTPQAFEIALEKGGIDLILSDSQLPNFDTMVALTLAQQKHPEIPFIFISGTDSPKTKRDAFRRGAVDFISKNNLPKLAHVIRWFFFLSKRKGRKPVLPEIGIPVMVQCKGFRCLGYFDQDGKWRDFGTSSELPDVMDWSAV